MLLIVKFAIVLLCNKTHFVDIILICFDFLIIFESNVKKLQNITKSCWHFIR